MSSRASSGPPLARSRAGSPALITRRRLREDVRDALLRMFTRGELTSGSRIKETDLAARLGVSRTPLREALMALEKEGYLESQPSRGFSVLPLTIEEVRETYPIIWSLEKLALELCDPADVDVDRLKKLNAQLAEASDPAVSKKLDTEFHATLVAASGNARLSQLLETLKLVARRYAAAHMRDERLLAGSRKQHSAIANACARGDLRKAAEVLEEHWRFGMENIIAWLERSE